MLVLAKQPDPVKVTLREAQGKEPEAFVMFAPITPAMRRRAHRAVWALLGVVDDVAELDADLIGDAAEKGSRELMRLGAIEWGGIGDEAGQLLALTPDRETRFATANAPDRATGTIDQLLADEDFFAKIEEGYIRPDALRRAEKNGSSASLNGTGGAATRGKDTANSPATRTAKKAAAKSAPTAKTRSKANKRKTSGRS